MEFKDKLQELRKKEGLSQEAFGAIANVSRQTVSKWELGETTPELKKLIELSEYFGISIDELVGKEGSRNDADDAAAQSGRDSQDYGHQESGHGDGRGYWYYDSRRPAGFEYISKTKVHGIPLVHVNIGYRHMQGYGRMRRAKGIIAIGNIAQGVLAIGGVAFGVLACGGVGFGLMSLGGAAIGLLFALGGISVGAVAIGGCCIGILAIGGCAVGIYAVGGLAAARDIAVGGYASGHIAIGEYADGAVRFFVKDGVKQFGGGEIRTAIMREFPHIWKVLADFFTGIAGVY